MYAYSAGCEKHTSPGSTIQPVKGEAESGLALCVYVGRYFMPLFLLEKRGARITF